MMRLPRFLPSLAVAGTISLSVGLPTAFGQAAAPGAPAIAPASAAPVVDKALLQSAEDFWHFASVGRFDLAQAQGEKIFAAGAPERDVLLAFETVVKDRNLHVAAERRVELYERLLAWQRVPELKDTSAKLIGIFNKAKQARAADPTFIEENLQRLSQGRRAYLLAVEQLKESGELAVPIMLAYLKDTAKQELHVPIRSALRDMGHRALNPLLAATEMKDYDALTWVCSALGDLGYDAAVPYLVNLYKGKETPAAVKTAASQALVRLNVLNPDQLDAAQLFHDLAERFYYEKVGALAADKSPVAFMWFMTGTGLHKQDVPGAVFNEHMALRACEYAMGLDGARSETISLWLASAYKREVEMPEGGVDPVWDEKHPDTHFYATTASTRHASPVLARALRDRNAAVALKAIKSLQEIVGSANLFAGDENKPVLDAMHYADRQVRFEAALTVAASLPQKAFVGQEYVIPILAEALGQTGKPGVLVMAGSQDELNKRLEALKKSGTYAVAGAVGAEPAVAAAATLSAVDVILMDEKNAEQIDRVFALARQNIRLERCAKLVSVTSKVASPFAAMALSNPLVSVTDAADETALAAAIEEARKRSGGLPLDEKLATGYALRAAEVLGKLALRSGTVLPVAGAQASLLAALDDSRPEVVKAAGAVLGLIDSKPAQTALLSHGIDEKTADDLKISALNHLARNAKSFGNHLEAAQAEALMKFVEAAQVPEVRAAAAEALGALNIPSSQIRTLILNQAKK